MAPSLHDISDLMTPIMIRIGRNSAKDLFRAASSCSLLNDASKSPEVLRQVNLHDLLTDPTVVFQCPSFFKALVDARNPTALYLNGVVKMRVHRDFEAGVMDFSAASKAGVDQATIMTAIACVACGLEWRGQETLDRIDGWKSRMAYMVSLRDEVLATLEAFQI